MRLQRLARGGDLEEVRVDARRSDRRARAGTLHDEGLRRVPNPNPNPNTLLYSPSGLHDEGLRRVPRRVERDDVVGVLRAREGVRLGVLAQLDGDRILLDVHDAHEAEHVAW